MRFRSSSLAFKSAIFKADTRKVEVERFARAQAGLLLDLKDPPFCIHFDSLVEKYTMHGSLQISDFRLQNLQNDR